MTKHAFFSKEKIIDSDSIKRIAAYLYAAILLK